MEQYPSNSRRPVDSEKTTQPSNGPVQLEPVVTPDKFIRRKKSLGQRIKEALFSGDTNSVVGYVLHEVLVPAFKATATDMVTQGIERALYGEVRSPRRSSSPYSNYQAPRTHISYNRPATVIRQENVSGPMQRRSSAYPSSSRVEDIVVEDYDLAMTILDSLYETLEKYGVVTVANLRQLLSETPMTTDYKWGWTDLAEAAIRRVPGGHRIILPNAEDIRDR